VPALGRWHKLPRQLDLAASEVDIVVKAEKVVSIGGLNLIWNDRCQCLLGGGGPVEGPKATDEAGRFDDESL